MTPYIYIDRIERGFNLATNQPERIKQINFEKEESSEKISKWLVRGDTNPNETYEVTVSGCSCPDGTNNYMCKHIHATIGLPIVKYIMLFRRGILPSQAVAKAAGDCLNSLPRWMKNNYIQELTKARVYT